MKLFFKIFKFFIILLFVVGAAFAFMIHIYANFYKIDDNVYRSAQLNSLNTSYYLQKYKIKTVLNLRGEPKSGTKWFDDEKKRVEQNGAQLISYDMFAGRFYDYKATSDLVNILRDSPKPLLIHCLNGADRTSLVSALYSYGVLNQTQDEAFKQLSWYYGHVPFFRPHVIAMDNSLLNYIKKRESVNKIKTAE
ncbi:MAG: hypothetical protein DRQ51_05640 [Gammaproteobacteria bacterium]|nr:MAG: hypothetical protein DRQ51_05640 [Gammaproteobacteria bacterium]